MNREKNEQQSPLVGPASCTGAEEGIWQHKCPERWYKCLVMSEASGAGQNMRI